MLKLIKHNLGIYFMLIACVYFALTGACAKILSESLPSIEVVFFRNLVGTVFVLYLISKLKVKKEGGHICLLIFRGVAGTISLYAFFYNVANIELGTAFAFQKTAPIFVALIAFFIFKESIGFFGSLGILLAFCGVLLISHPWIDDELHTGVDMTNTLIGVFSGLTAAMALTSVRQLRRYYATEIIASSFIIIGAILPLFSMLIGSFYSFKYLDFMIAPFVMPSGFKTWALIFLMGLFGILYQIYVTKAYGIAKKAGVVAGISYFDVLFSLALGLMLGDDLPSAMVFMGIIGVVFGGLILIKAKK